MQYIYFYASIALVLILFSISAFFRPLGFRHYVIWITSISYSLIYEITFGALLKLYYYIEPQGSILYILISSIFLYPILNLLYIIYLPKTPKSVILYSVFWIIGLLLFELLSIKTRTIVLTGWAIMPWSILTYAFTLLLLYLLNNYMIDKIIGSIRKT